MLSGDEPEKLEIYPSGVLETGEETAPEEG
jgi:hypothetical protein